MRDCKTWDSQKSCRVG